MSTAAGPGFVIAVTFAVVSTTVDDADAGRRAAGIGERRGDVGFTTDEDDLRDARVGFERLARSLDNDRGAVVAAHDIQRDAHKRKSAEVGPSAPARTWLANGLDRDHLAALVKAATGAHTVGQARRGALRAGVKLGQREHAVVGRLWPRLQPLLRF